MMFDDADRFHYIGGISSPGSRRFSDRVVDNTGLDARIAAARLRLAVSRAVFNGMVNAC